MVGRIAAENPDRVATLTCINMPLWHNPDLEPVKMPTMFIWPPKAGNVFRETAEANAL